MDVKQFWNWFIAFKDPYEIWQENPTFLLGECGFILMSLLALIHACQQGGRYPWIWVTAIMHGLTVEGVSYMLPDIDNFWHSQGTVMFLGKRLPLYIVCLYPSFIYPASAAVARLRLSAWVEPLAVGLGVVLIDMPFDIMGVKLLWWTWHDTDPSVYDRHYWVPWNSYYFHVSFACGFTFLFHGTRRMLSSTQKYQADNFFVELVCSLVTGMFAMPLGVLQFIPIYHPLHDIFHIHSEVCVLLYLMIFALLVWAADRCPSKEAHPPSNKGWFDLLAVCMILYYSAFMCCAIWAKPEQYRSTGLHEPVGPCDSISPVQTPIGLVLSKRTYLCLDDYHEDYFNFDCVKPSAMPKNGSEWYTVCGTPFPNHIEYMVVVAMECFLGVFVYLNWLSRSGKQPRAPKNTSKVKGKRD